MHFLFLTTAAGRVWAGVTGATLFSPSLPARGATLLRCPRSDARGREGVRPTQSNKGETHDRLVTVGHNNPRTGGWAATNQDILTTSEVKLIFFFNVSIVEPV